MLICQATQTGSDAFRQGLADTFQQCLLVDPVQRIEYAISTKHDDVQACAPETSSDTHLVNSLPHGPPRTVHILVHSLPITENVLWHLDQQQPKRTNANSDAYKNSAASQVKREMLFQNVSWVACGGTRLKSSDTVSSMLRRLCEVATGPHHW